LSKSHPTQANGFPAVLDVQRLFAVAIAFLSYLACASPVLAQDNDDPNAQLGQALGNLLINSISQAMRDNAARSWQQVKPEILSCLETQYSVDPDQLAQQGIGAGSSKLKPYVKECQRLTAAPPVQIDGFVESTPGLYTRTISGLANIGSRYAVRTTASAASGDTREARYNALLAKVKEGCKSDSSIAAIRFYGEKDPNTKANRLNEKWADAEVECADPQAGEDSTDALAIDDLTNGDRDALFFDVHSADLNAPFKGAFDTVMAALHAHAYHIVRSDKDKGVIVTGNPGRHEFSYSEACYIVLAPETNATSRITLKLVEGSLEPVHNAATLFHPQDHDVVNRRAEQFISEVQQRLGGGHV
jgi:hypothetical protein